MDSPGDLGPNLVTACGTLAQSLYLGPQVPRECLPGTISDFTCYCDRIIDSTLLTLRVSPFGK